MKRGFLLRAQQKKDRAKKISGEKVESQPVISGAEKPTVEPYTPLSYGKLSDAEKALPDDHEQFISQFSSIIDYKESDLAVPKGLMVATVPQLEDGDGTAQWVVKERRKIETVLNIPGYPSRMPKPRLPSMAVVRETPDMGLGLFVGCDIRAGELVFAERPLLVKPAVVICPAIPHYSAEQQRQLNLAIDEKNLQYAMARMSVEKQEAFMSLANNHTEDGSGPIVGITRTNSYGLDLGDGDDSQTNKYVAVVEIGSRINHSCRPNIGQEFEVASFSLQFYATKDIKAGEQLVYAYCGIDASLAQRRARLAPYGVVCKCLSCLDPSLKSDNIRLNYTEAASAMNQFCTQTIQQRRQRIPPSALEAMLALERDMVEEGIDGCETFFSLVVNISIGYLSLGNLAKRDAYMRRCPAKINCMVTSSILALTRISLAPLLSQNKPCITYLTLTFQSILYISCGSRYLHRFKPIYKLLLK